MKTTPKVQKYMTAFPYTIGSDISVKKAVEMMREHQIRHLPVQKGGKLVGVITDRDIKLAASFKDAGEMLVDDVMSPDPYTVDPDATLDSVAAEMAEHKYGCAIVALGNGKVVGIFTEVDALRALAETLRLRFKGQAA